MKKIKYEDYVKYVDKRLYTISGYEDYTSKYMFTKPNLSYFYVANLFRRYMHDDIFIKWDMEDEED